MFHPKSPYFKICADVVVQNVTVVKDHTHSIPSTSSSSSPRQTSTLKSFIPQTLQLGRSLTDSTFNCFPSDKVNLLQDFLDCGFNYPQENISVAKGFTNKADEKLTTKSDRRCGCYCFRWNSIDNLF